jgi:hypothetical protein
MTEKGQKSYGAPRQSEGRRQFRSGGVLGLEIRASLSAPADVGLPRSPSLNFRSTRCSRVPAASSHSAASGSHYYCPGELSPPGPLRCAIWDEIRGNDFLTPPPTLPRLRCRSNDSFSRYTFSNTTGIRLIMLTSWPFGCMRARRRCDRIIRCRFRGLFDGLFRGIFCIFG